jgi:hypothetical protein
MRKWFRWQIGRILLPAALVPVTLAGLAVSATQASAQVDSTTTVTASPMVAGVGQSVTLTAEVTCAGDPSGGLGLSFSDGPNLIATVPVDSSGDASLTTTFSTAGTHTITASYDGNSNCYASYSTMTVTVTAVPIPPGLIGIILGGINIGNRYTYNSYTFNEINSHNKSSVIKSVYNSIGH